VVEDRGPVVEWRTPTPIATELAARSSRTRYSEVRCVAPTIGSQVEPSGPIVRSSPPRTFVDEGDEGLALVHVGEDLRQVAARVGEPALEGP
jgi:hypothetical protein